MCGPSSQLKAVNQTIQNFSNQVTDEAGTVFGASNQVFNNMIGPLQQIVNGGPSQEGFSAAELSERNAAAVNAGATEARNLKGAAASGTAAIGGGNVPVSSGSTQATVLGAEQKAASDTASAENEIMNENFERGNKNFEFATQAEQNLPNVFNASTGANNTAVNAQGAALKSQQAIDTAKNWWQPMITAAIGGASSALTGGLTGGFGGGGGAGTPLGIQGALNMGGEPGGVATEGGPDTTPWSI